MSGKPRSKPQKMTSYGNAANRLLIKPLHSRIVSDESGIQRKKTLYVAEVQIDYSTA